MLLPPSLETVLPLAAGVAVADAVKTFGVTAELKWPNDVLARGRKLAGILAEGISGAAGLEGVVLGVGVNVSLDPAALSTQIGARTTSIAAETGRDADPLEVAAEVLARLAVWYHALANDGAAAILHEWRARSVPWWGEAVEILSGEAVLKGVAAGLDERGALLIDAEDGSRKAVLSGEVRELRLR